MPASVLDLEIAATWGSRYARHSDRHRFAGVSTDTDRIATLDVQFARLRPGETVRLADRFTLGERDPHQVRTVSLYGWRRPPLQVGRYYPRGLLNEFPRTDLRPFRAIAISAAGVLADFNAPLRGVDLAIDCSATSLRVSPPPSLPVHDLLDRLANGGPGMQAASPEADTDFLTGTPFARGDESDDACFYERERLVDHLDAPSRAEITALYRRLLRPGMAVLDLMSSWNSHLPEAVDLTVTGLGMNTTELGQNPRLATRLIHDLNQGGQLPWPDATFDAALCALSIEYLTQPLTVVGEVARVLKPGAPFIITFSDRWFPPKAIRLWSELHPFERMALVVDYLRLSGEFENLETQSVRGLPAPPSSSRSHDRPYADPLFAVWGYRVKRR